MEITCWGSRGSISVSGKDYLKYGGDTTCIEIRTESNDTIIVDAGTGIRRVGNRLLKEGRFRYDLIFTHGHWDHLMGFPFFKPLYNRRTKIRMHRCRFHGEPVESMLSKVMAPPNFPIPYADLKAEMSYEDVCPGTFDIGSVSVTPIPISHPNNGSGYKFSENGRSFVFLTDNELGYIHPGGETSQTYEEFSADADLLIHDAEFTPEEYRSNKKWGHSAYTEAVDLALASRAKQLGLFHLNQDRSDGEMDEIVENCRQRIAEKGQTFPCFGVATDMTFSL